MSETPQNSMACAPLPGQRPVARLWHSFMVERYDLKITLYALYSD